MADTISRQAAIDTVVFECGEWTGLAKEISKQLRQLPSVQPEQKDFEKQLHAMFDHIWDCEIDHPVFQDTVGELMEAVIQAHKNSAQPERIQNNAVHLCDSCQYTYVTCPSHGNDAVFGDGKGNDNICACNKYRPISAQPEQRWIPCSECEKRCSKWEHLKT